MTLQTCRRFFSSLSFFSAVIFIVKKKTLLECIFFPGNPSHALTLTRTRISQLIICGRVALCVVWLEDTHHIRVNEHAQVYFILSLLGGKRKQAG